MHVREIVKGFLQVKAQDCPGIFRLHVDNLMFDQHHGVLGREWRPEANHVVRKETMLFNVFVNDVFGHLAYTGCPFRGHYFLVMVDAFSKWVDVHPVPSPSAEATISVFRTVFSQHGLPDIIVSDNGPAFTSSQYADFLNRNGIRRMMVPPYHPASNGAAERVQQNIKDKLKKSTPGEFRTQVVLFHYRSTPHDAAGRVPRELLMGKESTPLDVMRPSLRSSVQLNQIKQKLHANKGCRIAPIMDPGAPVFTRNFRSSPPWISQLNNKQQRLWSLQELLLSQNSHQVSPTTELSCQQQSSHREEALPH
ncbi:uncharacterized protein LOC119435817 [Dermacentor silvarum]|uniref:uncharacterized protein LOC119435817 n=1 Tax=Dermacentor silvarum TaxID=543639 RepID=UPI0018998C9F|nr:uncharacterized protein LOC119435817 [Dermacentor silvarum]